ncbi:MAG: hypothetical protein JWO91_1966, partial [Acidobacteriaceae bacterium]|nr:hypothetical protein [Acidobacteriaceae bacterium]
PSVIARGQSMVWEVPECKGILVAPSPPIVAHLHRSSDGAACFAEADTFAVGGND